MLEPHLAPVGVDLFCDDGGEARRDALAEFDMAQIDGDRVVGTDPHIIAKRGLRDGAGRSARAAHVAADRETGCAETDDAENEAAGRREACCVSHAHYPMISEARATAPRMR